MTPARTLTERQLQVLFLVAEGHTNAEIGRQLHLTQDTVRTHLYRVFAHLGAKSRAHAVAIVLRKGLIP